MTKSKIKTYTLQEMKDKYIGKKGTPARDQYEFKIQKDVLRNMIKKSIPTVNLK